MQEFGEMSDLVAFLVKGSRLSSAEASRIVDEVMLFLRERPEEFVARRHRELQAEGMRNTDIYKTIIYELAQRRFGAPEYTERQIRRIIYG